MCVCVCVCVRVCARIVHCALCVVCCACARARVRCACVRASMSEHSMSSCCICVHVPKECPNHLPTDYTNRTFHFIVSFKVAT